MKVDDIGRGALGVTSDALDAVTRPVCLLWNSAGHHVDYEGSFVTYDWIGCRITGVRRGRKVRGNFELFLPGYPRSLLSFISLRASPTPYALVRYRLGGDQLVCFPSLLLASARFSSGFGVPGRLCRWVVGGVCLYAQLG